VAEGEGVAESNVLPTRTISCWIHAGFPVVCGATIYLLFRSSHLLVFSWLDALHLNSTVTTLRIWVAPLRSDMPEWILYSLPDGLWVYGLTASLSLLGAQSQSWLKLGWPSAGILLAFVGELGQYLGFIPGSFDPVDLLFCIVGFGLALIFTRRHKETHEAALTFATGARIF
jgi:hypothetical protein